MPVAAQTATGSSVTYTADVAPFLERECTGCHRSGGVGPFSLETYDDVRSQASAILRVLRDGDMPPWPPEAPPGTFVGQPQVSASDVDMVSRWTEAGAPRGAVRTTHDEGSDLPEQEPDLVVGFPAYPVPADGPDLYPSVVASIPDVGERWIQRVEIRPGDSGAVHHLFMRVDTTSSSRELAARSAVPGFNRLEFVSDAAPPGGDYMAWAPGQRNLPALDGVAWRLPAGADLVADLHLRPTGRPADVSVQVAFYYADRPPAVEPLIIGLMADEIDIPAGSSDYVVHDTLTLPVDVDVLSVYPHAHFLGQDLQGLAKLPSGRTLTLVHIPDWDFNWQGEYRFTEPVRLPAGTVIIQHFTYDNTADNPDNPYDPPRRAVMGRAATDEMAELTLRVVPRNETDRETLAAAFGRRIQARTMARVARLRVTDGEQRFAEGDLEDATRLFQEALRYRSDNVEALNWLSRTFAARGDFGSALLVAERAVRVSNGRDAEALAAFAEAHAGLGQLDQAADVARRAIDVAEDSGEEELADTLRTQVRRYREGGR